ncbi:leucyl aminopeptidase [Kineosporia sp. NBRC 101731]|uniref:leucyl aminopeptidase n=1 Tax=Kineosporia sp. NBRC 101731 TaxID=3032199 RepID=UPI0024A3E529|nr:leucyl aminopeptidase [Kineosporia sp. NBRC 101731]GLY32811.1 putative cytosol aminopeptidase [Kineosporia sp. NBRC 101731]
MPTLSVTAKEAVSQSADALVIGVGTNKAGAVLAGAPAFPAPVRTALTQAVKAVGATGAKGTLHRIPPVAGVSAKSVVLVGLGAPAEIDHETLRRAAGAATRELAGLAKVVFGLPTTTGEDVTAVAEGALFGAYTYNRYRTGDSVKTPVGTIVVSAPAAANTAARAGIRRAKVLADAVHGTRDLINAAPIDLFPAQFADDAQRVVKDLPVTVTVLDEKKLLKGGYGGLIGVGQGSSRPPRLVKLEYKPTGATTHVALVGKGITFDSGGISIKPAASMDDMKSDMSGAAAVLHAVAAIAELRLPVHVTGWLALAENMPSGTAQRPSDVITIRGGRTVEVLNTDAEGRLVLADAIVAAGETNPDVIVDIATLTGAQLVALGSRTSAIMSNDDDLRNLVHTVSGEAGEAFWPMPLPQELRPSMDSRVADIANIGERFGGMMVAGLFLKEFVPSTDDGAQTPWAHLDIAGPAYNTGSAYGYTPAGGTGHGVRTMVALCESLATTPLH